MPGLRAAADKRPAPPSPNESRQNLPDSLDSPFMDHHQPVPGSNAERIADAVQQRDSTKLHEALQAMFDEEVLPDIRERLHAERPEMADFTDSDDFAEHAFKEWATQTLEKSLAGIRAQRAQAIEGLRGTAIPYSAFEYTDNDWGLVGEGD